MTDGQDASCPDAERATLLKKIAQLTKVNVALMGRVEREMDMQGEAYSLFQAATVLEERVRQRTAALGDALRELKNSNLDLTIAKDRAEAAARAKDEFLAGMSHELRTPLNAVLGLSEALQDEIYGPLNEKQRECLGTIESSGRHLLSLIGEILDIAKVGAGGLQLTVEPVDIRDLSEGCLQMVATQAKKKQLKLDWSIAPGIASLRTDSKRLKQILVNLLGNAVKFTPNGGDVSLEVARSEDGAMLEFLISDTGIGIPEDDLCRVFEPFVQLDSRLARQYDGTGLGLALVLQLSRALGGGVEAVSRVGEGSRFTVRLPYVVAESEVRVSEPVQSVAGSLSTRRGRPVVVLAEDNEANRATIGDYLTAKGYQVETAVNGVEAVALVKQLKPDIVLMDIQMPEMDGLEATRSLRSEPEFAELPIVALTAMAMAGDSKRCLDAGATDYVTKPVRLKSLVELMAYRLSPEAGRPSLPPPVSLPNQRSPSVSPGAP